jgi:hypothetical protein
MLVGKMALAASSHVQDPGRYDGVHDFDGEADGAIKLVGNAYFYSARIAVHEGRGRVPLGRLLHHEVGHHSTMSQCRVEGKVVFQAEVVNAYVPFGTRDEDSVDAAELAGVRGAN